MGWHSAVLVPIKKGTGPFCSKNRRSRRKLGTIRPQTLHIARHRRRHTQTGIGIKIVGAQAALHQLLGDVVIFRLELARPVHANYCRPLGFAPPFESHQ